MEGEPGTDNLGGCTGEREPVDVDFVSGEYQRCLRCEMEAPEDHLATPEAIVDLVDFDQAAEFGCHPSLKDSLE
jgi:hypothetical protein